VFVIQNSLFAQDAKFEQQVEDGLVVMEAENYSAILPSVIDTTEWQSTVEPAGFSGDSAMYAYPYGSSVHKEIEYAQDNAPILQYIVNFVSADPVYVWARTVHTDGYDDSAWFGLDGLIEGDLPISYLGVEQDSTDWYWIGYLMGDDTPTRAVLEIHSTGVKTFEFYMREGGLRVDKMILTTNEEYAPVGVGPDETLAEVTDVEPLELSVANDFRLSQNYPNPFNPVTSIRYNIGSTAKVKLVVHNLLGKEVATLVNEVKTQGEHTAYFNAANLPSGVYFYTLESGVKAVTKKMVLMK
jgi:hypothetical protein